MYISCLHVSIYQPSTPMALIYIYMRGRRGLQLLWTLSLLVLSIISHSMCQGLGPKRHYEISEIDRITSITIIHIYIYIYVYTCVYIYIYTYIYIYI